VQSLREGTNAEALRRARTCYDHLAGRLGVALMDALLAQGLLEGGDGTFDPDRSTRDRLSAPGWDVAYVLSDERRARLESLGVDCSGAGRRPLIRYCVDWSEQRHHLAGTLGARLLGWFEDEGWVTRRSGSRALTITDAGARQMGPSFGVDIAGVLAVA
jgi:hypothetical protein